MTAGELTKWVPAAWLKSVALESVPDADAGRRFGGRVDLQYGQATETLQGNLANEPRPWVYRNIFQAFGTSRLLIGSDWPVCTLAADYAGTMGLVIDYVNARHSAAADAIFGGNATTFYGIEVAPP